MCVCMQVSVFACVYVGLSIRVPAKGVSQLGAAQLKTAARYSHPFSPLSYSSSGLPLPAHPEQAAGRGGWGWGAIHTMC